MSRPTPRWVRELWQHAYEWRQTARIYANPKLRRALTEPLPKPLYDVELTAERRAREREADEDIAAGRFTDHDDAEAMFAAFEEAIDVPADLHFEDDEGFVLARVPDAGAPAPGSVVTAGTPGGWTWAAVHDVEDGWLRLQRVTAGIFVDYALVGHARRFMTPVKRQLRTRLHAGDLVAVLGDDVPPALARVLYAPSGSPNVELELLDEASDTGRADV